MRYTQFLYLCWILLSFGGYAVDYKRFSILGNSSQANENAEFLVDAFEYGFENQSDVTITEITPISFCYADKIFLRGLQNGVESLNQKDVKVILGNIDSVGLTEYMIAKGRPSAIGLAGGAGMGALRNLFA